MIKIFNMHNRKISKKDVCYVGRPSVLGNPFIIGKDGTRFQVIDKYRKWLNKKLQTDKKVKAHFDILKDKYLQTGRLYLYCWCKPRLCHADVIANAILEMV